MTKFVATSEFPSDSSRYQNKWVIYLLLGLVTNVITWSAALLYLKASQPVYKSEWALSVPGVKSYTNINVPGIGQASSSSDSPYMSEVADPRENYKFLAGTMEVLELAANQLNIPVGKFGRPKIKIIDNSTLMSFEIEGGTPQEAQNKAFALHNALKARLDTLRKEEMAQQDQRLETTLGSSEKKLQAAQQRLSTYKASSGLSSPEQLRELSVNLEVLRRQRAEVVAQMEQANTNSRQLAAKLGLSAQQAADALALQSDQLFQQYLTDYSQVTAELTKLTSKFASAHPRVLDKQAEQEAVRSDLLQQGQSLLGQTVTLDTLKQLNLNEKNSSPQRSILFKDLISLQTEQQGLQSQAQELERQIAMLESRLTSFAQKESELDELKRDVQIAETVFSSTLTRLDLSQSEVSASYPSIALFTKPSLSEESTKPKRKLVLAGAGMASLFFTTGTVSLWVRDRKMQQAQQIRRKNQLF
ncbi:MAG: hypothetical protein LDL41_02390 [Coleofasciculus sp. S288]|nr:hypothetical protein [Coleofasciculus sp. S288]